MNYFKKKIEIERKKLESLKSREIQIKENFYKAFENLNPIDMAWIISERTSDKMSKLEIELELRTKRLERLALVHNAIILGACIYLIGRF